MRPENLASLEKMLSDYDVKFEASQRRIAQARAVTIAAALIVALVFAGGLVVIGHFIFKFW